MASSPSPEDAARGALAEVADDKLPGIAALWLVDGYDSQLLRGVAAMSTREGRDARSLMPAVLASVGYPLTGGSWDGSPWRGCWPTIGWAISEIDHKLSPYAAAQHVLEVVGDVPDLWEPGRGDELMDLLRAWDHRSRDRSQIGSELRAVLRGLHRDDVPPLDGPWLT